MSRRNPRAGPVARRIPRRDGSFGYVLVVRLWLRSTRNKWFTRHRVVDLTDARVRTLAECEASRAAETLSRQALAASAEGRVAARAAYDLAYSGGNHRDLDAAGHPRE